MGEIGGVSAGQTGKTGECFYRANFNLGFVCSIYDYNYDYIYDEYIVLVLDSHDLLRHIQTTCT